MKKKFLSLTVPSALAMFVASFNTVLDGMFLGIGVGDDAIAGVNIVIPVIMIFIGISNMAAVGGGSLVSKNFGEGDSEKAVNIFRQVIKSLIVLSLIISIVCVGFSETIVILLGAKGRLVTIAAEYLRYYSIFCISSVLMVVFGSFLRNDNAPKLAMFASMAATVINIILNYVFIFVLQQGVKSAAVATGIGNSIAIMMMLPHFIFKRGQLSFGKTNIGISAFIEAMKIGFPSFLAEAAFSVIIFFHNIALSNTVGESGIAAYAIINYATSNIYNIVLGITMGAQPLISYNFGTENKENMLTFYNMTIKMCIFVSAVITLAYAGCGRFIAGIFSSSPEVIDMAVVGLNLTNAAYIFLGVNLTRTIYYQAIEKTIYSNIMGLLRSVVILPIVLFVFAGKFGVNGIWASQLVAECIVMVFIGLTVNISYKTDLAIKNKERYTGMKTI